MLLRAAIFFLFSVFQVHGTVLFPTLARMARDYLGIAATSVDCERLFSEAGDMVTDSRNRLSADSIKSSMILSSMLAVEVPKRIPGRI
jgi:hypothetical protein